MGKLGDLMIIATIIMAIELLILFGIAMTMLLFVLIF